MTAPQVVIHATPDLLAAAAAARLVTRLVDAQTAKGTASLVLTGGGTGIAVLKHLNSLPARDAVDWSKVDLYWGDERFLPAGHPDRNETQARQALLDQIRLDPTRVHPMAPSDGRHGDNPEAAAEAYAELLADAARHEDHGPVPTFDILLLGVGEEGHTLSVFPSSPAVYEKERTVVAVRNCPKPPPTRITMTLPTARRATEVWLMTAGTSKSAAVSMALTGAGEVALPAAGAKGRLRTLWLLDKAAATRVPNVFTPPLA